MIVRLNGILKAVFMAITLALAIAPVGQLFAPPNLREVQENYNYRIGQLKGLAISSWGLFSGLTAPICSFYALTRPELSLKERAVLCAGASAFSFISIFGTAVFGIIAEDMNLISNNSQWNGIENVVKKTLSLNSKIGVASAALAAGLGALALISKIRKS